MMIHMMMMMMVMVMIMMMMKGWRIIVTERRETGHLRLLHCNAPSHG